MDDKAIPSNTPPSSELPSIEVTPQERADREKKLKKACADFESIFVYQMLKTMRSAGPKSGLFGKITGKETYEMMMDQKVAEELANKGGGLGLQKMLFNQLHKVEGGDLKKN